MDDHHLDDQDTLAERSTRLIRHLEGALDASMLDAMSGVWSTLEHAATDAPAHGRAVRQRLFWQSLTPGATAADPTPYVQGPETSWDEHDESEGYADAA